MHFVMKLLAAFALAATLLTAFFSICTDMAGGSSASMDHFAMKDAMMLDCMPVNSHCQLSLRDHMSLFAEAHPFAAQAADTLLAFIFIAAAFLAVTSLRHLLIDTRLRSWFRQRKRALDEPILSACLAFAFSQGILHSKRYAA